MLLFCLQVSLKTFLSLGVTAIYYTVQLKYNSILKLQRRDMEGERKHPNLSVHIEKKQQEQINLLHSRQYFYTCREFLLGIRNKNIARNIKLSLNHSQSSPMIAFCNWNNSYKLCIWCDSATIECSKGCKSLGPKNSSDTINLALKYQQVFPRLQVLFCS